MFISQPEEQEQKCGDSYTRNMLGHLERGLEPYWVAWCARENKWLANASASKDFLTSLIECEIKMRSKWPKQTRSATLCECRQSWAMILSPWTQWSAKHPWIRDAALKH